MSADIRLSTISDLAVRMQGGMGRTALMKLVYFLQVLKGVPLGYRFRIYTYGPFDEQVLEDLSVAETRRVVKSEAVEYPGGIGYQISAGENAEAQVKRARSELARYEQALDWVVDRFGRRTAVDLEMASTIVFIDRAAKAAGKTHSASELGAAVKAVKPRLDLQRILAEIDRLRGDNLLVALRDA